MLASGLQFSAETYAFFRQFGPQLVKSITSAPGATIAPAALQTANRSFFTRITGRLLGIAGLALSAKQQIDDGIRLWDYSVHQARQHHPDFVQIMQQAYPERDLSSLTFAEVKEAAYEISSTLPFWKIKERALFQQIAGFWHEECVLHGATLCQQEGAIILSPDDTIPADLKVERINQNPGKPPKLIRIASDSDNFTSPLSITAHDTSDAQKERIEKKSEAAEKKKKATPKKDFHIVRDQALDASTLESAQKLWEARVSEQSRITPKNTTLALPILFHITASGKIEQIDIQTDKLKSKENFTDEEIKLLQKIVKKMSVDLIRNFQERFPNQSLTIHGLLRLRRYHIQGRTWALGIFPHRDGHMSISSLLEINHSNNLSPLFWQIGPGQEVEESTAPELQYEYTAPPEKIEIVINRQLIISNDRQLHAVTPMKAKNEEDGFRDIAIIVFKKDCVTPATATPKE